MKQMTLNYYQDPGHGWVKIKLAKLISLGIDLDISNYSYIRNDNVFLEEDCDLARLYKACDDKGIVIKLKEYHTNKQSKIRSYDNYSKYKNNVIQTLNLWNT